jgi:hypothetical protein
MDSKNRKFAIISVDVNDGDIESHTIEVTEEQAIVLNNVAKAIKEFKPYEAQAHGMTIKHEHNFPTGECLRTDMGEIPPEEYYIETDKISMEDFREFFELVPYTECGFHDVTEIRILAVIGEIKLI